MKRKSLKLLASALLITMMGVGMIGCGSSNNDTGADKSADTTKEQSVSGSITISGSSALLPLMEQSIEKFNEKYPDVEISAQAGGSGTGLTQVLDGTVNIGNSDIFAEDKLEADQAKQLVDHKVVAQGFAVVVSKSLGIDNLTKDQIKDIFSGKVTNWNQITKEDGTAGPDKEIFVVHRKSGSGTRATFEEKILDGDKSLENDSIGVMQDSNGAVLTAMKQNEGAISYLGLAYMNTDEAKEALTSVKIDGKSDEKANICDGSYPFWSWGHMYTKGEADEASKAFIEYVSSSDNKESLENLGFISGNEMKVK
ncbi:MULTISPECIES: phosphate ABC transporter substrate-binding protein [Clostridium]|jgi:phosphate transport system substrate-binding protein|uniref:phosphate ABC transporter substrate-binding protein n=1 Tax=Clostridium TaxID=1485 RepID=UPI0002CBFE80|nr:MULTISPECIES: phosphate ABC transporter substrate-binding protein [Clostridium]ALP89937.1 phosphate ABC transporter substrate-binding protein [Clostridium butyricum]ALS16390.1 phosphate ABC transporter substrate-binding protein [Clostridium butyricum]ANF13553.1 phosphate ABC transporter substrate-binding protein [Clostridium butyricum]AOR93621.1 phosphate ABC transporter substrate-binding protein [Clostridium butyricum]EMU54202.1 phosphate binding protein [Clostridium butyricum DKU-01]